jgi:hypothetical protein
LFDDCSTMVMTPALLLDSLLASALLTGVWMIGGVCTIVCLAIRGKLIRGRRLWLLTGTPFAFGAVGSASLVFLFLTPSGLSESWAQAAAAPLFGSLLASSTLIIAARYVAPQYTRWRNQLHHTCDECGYNLTGNTSGICPECGSHIRE